MKTSLAALLGFVAMTVVGWKMADEPATKDPDRALPKTRRAERQARESKSGPATLAGQQLAAIRAAATPEARLAATLALANSLPSSEIAAWLDGGWFNVGGGPERLIFQNILLARWRETDPEGLLVWSLKNDAGARQNMIAALAEESPQWLIDFFKSHPDKAAEFEAVQAIASTHPALALHRLQELVDAGTPALGGSEFSALFRQLAKSSPAGLEAALGSLPLALRKDAEKALCGHRLATSFSTEIRALWGRSDGWALYSSNLAFNPELRKGLLAELAELPPRWKEEFADNASRFITRDNTAALLDSDLEGDGFTARQAEKIRKEALDLMSWYDPEEALTRMAEMGSPGLDRKELIGRMFRSLAYHPERVDSLMTRLDSEEEREHARKSLVLGKSERLRGDGVHDEFKTANPADWLERIGGLDPTITGSTYPYLSQMERWDAGKLAELDRQFAALPKARKQQAAWAIAASTGYDASYAPVIGEAIRHLLLNPAARPDSKSDLARRASEYASRLAFNDPAAASEWVGSLPAGNEKLWAQKNLARNWAVYDPRAAGQWVDSLPADARNQVRTFLEKE